MIEGNPTPEFLREELGFSVIPIIGKKPPIGFLWKPLQRRLPSGPEVSAWSCMYDSYAIICGAVSGIVVVDIDSPEADLAARERGLPEPSIKTRTAKGEHWFYRHPGGMIKNKVKILGTALDVRADGGYVVGPGSIHDKTGVVYEAQGSWTREELERLPLFDISWVPVDRPAKARITVSSSGSTSRAYRRASRYIATMGPAIEGQGGDPHTFKVAARLYDYQALTDSERLDILREWNCSCIPPWDDQELQTKLRNAHKYGSGGGDMGPDLEPESESEEVEEPLVMGEVETEAIEEPEPKLQPEPEQEHEPEQEPKEDKDEEEGAWGPPLPIEIDRPEFPVELMPDLVHRFVSEVARVTQTSSCMPAMLAISALSLAALKRFQVQIDSTWTEPMAIYTVSAADPGTRKSPIFKLVTGPLWKYEIEEVRRAEEALKNNREIIEHKKALLAGNRKQASQSKSGDGMRIIYDGADQLAMEIANLEAEGVARQIICDDATTEAIVQLLAENNGRIGNFSSEGDLFKILAGRYNDGKGNFSVFLKGYSADPVTVNRKNQPRLLVESPLMALGIMTQPSVMESLRKNTEMRSQGLLARFLYALPLSTVGERIGRPENIDQAAIEDWNACIVRLLKQPEENRTFTLSKEAAEMFQAFNDYIERRMATRGDLRTLRDWGSKICGTTARVAALFHICQPGFHDEISADTMADAIDISDLFFIPHARLALDQFGSEDIPEDCRILLEACAEEPVTVRDIRRNHRKRFEGQGDSLQAAINFLEDHNFIRCYLAPAEEKGGRPKRVLEKNPLLEIGSIPVKTCSENGPKNGNQAKTPLSSAKTYPSESSNDATFRGFGGFGRNYKKKKIYSTLYIEKSFLEKESYKDSPRESDGIFSIPEKTRPKPPKPLGASNGAGLKAEVLAEASGQNPLGSAKTPKEVKRVTI